MLTRTAFKQRSRDGQCLGSRTCPFYGVDRHGLCSGCNGTLKKAPSDEPITDRIARYPGLSIATDQLTQFWLEFAIPTMARYPSTSWQVRIALLLAVHASEYRGVLFDAKTIDATRNRLLEAWGTPTGPNAIVFDAFFIAITWDLEGCKSSFDSSAICYFAYPPPRPIEAIFKMYSHLSVHQNLSLWTAHGQVT